MVDELLDPEATEFVSASTLPDTQPELIFVMAEKP